MSDLTRRNFAAGLALLATAGAQQPLSASGGSKVFVPALATMPNGTQRASILSLVLGTGEAVSMHESVVPAGTPQAPVHVIKHSELIVIVEGTLSFEHDGITDQAHAGDVIYVAYGTNHCVWNTGSTPAHYFVMQMGGDTKKS